MPASNASFPAGEGLTWAVPTTSRRPVAALPSTSKSNTATARTPPGCGTPPKLCVKYRTAWEPGTSRSALASYRTQTPSPLGLSFRRANGRAVRPALRASSWTSPPYRTSSTSWRATSCGLHRTTSCTSSGARRAHGKKSPPLGGSATNWKENWLFRCSLRTFSVKTRSGMPPGAPAPPKSGMSTHRRSGSGAGHAGPTALRMDAKALWYGALKALKLQPGRMLRRPCAARHKERMCRNWAQARSTSPSRHSCCTSASAACSAASSL
mmetsp:Transcript_19270/g.57880  ORF Transcript_19270/g.57880 Transcript_19270/m.57880 type:complete len:267 (-) Transcript_19270:240-1040(-)